MSDCCLSCRGGEEHAGKLAPAFYKVLGSLQRKDDILDDRGQQLHCCRLVPSTAPIIPEARNTVTGFQYEYLYSVCTGIND